MILYELIIIGFLILLNGVFSCYEMALASISQARLMVLVNQKKKGAQMARLMKDRMETSLAVVQLAITLFGSIAAAVGGIIVEEHITPVLQRSLPFHNYTVQTIAVLIFIIPLSGITIVFAELIPKMFALTYREWVCLTLSPVMYSLSRIAYPIVAVFEHTVRGVMSLVTAVFRSKESAHDAGGLHELNAAVAMARTARIIGAHEEKIVLSAAQLSVRPIHQILIPASDLSMVPLHLSLAEALVQAHLDLHTRFPVCDVEGDPQTIRGYITFKDLVVALKMNSASTVEGILRPIKRFSEETSIAQALDAMIHDKIHIALVVTKEETVIGMITLEDVMEELVGDIEDEFDRLPAHIHPVANGWIMGGGVHMDVVAATTGLSLNGELPKGKAPVLAEWCNSSLGRPIKKGEVVTINGLTVSVRKLRRHKLAEGFIIVERRLAPRAL